MINKSRGKGKGKVKGRGRGKDRDTDSRGGGRDFKDKAGGARGFFTVRKRVCKFCVEKVKSIDYKNMQMLSKSITERGKIIPNRISGTCAGHQRQLADAIKAARFIALLPYTVK